MKKLSFLTVAAGAMMLASCSQDGEVITSVEGGEGVQQIVLQVASNGDGLTTRAGRELLSDEPGQKIDVVDIYIVDNTNKVVYSYPDYNWKDANTTGYDNGTWKTLTLSKDEKLNDGEYTIYALGHTASAYSEYNIETFAKDDTKDFTNWVLKYKEEKDTPEEIFAGSAELTVKDKTFTKPVILNRQVAGAYFYVYNLPKVDGLDTECEIQLVASDFNDQLVLGNFANSDHGNNVATTAKYVVNGINSDASHTDTETVLCSTSITYWYKDIVDNDNDGIVDVEYTTKDENDQETTVANWISTKDAKVDTNNKRQGNGFVKGSMFASSFIIPFKNVEKQTLKLQIVKSGQDKPLRSWNVNLQAKDAPTTLDYYVTATTEWKTNESVSEDIHNYSIVRNHLYSVGKKSKANPKDPENPDDPDPDDPDPDDPEDLSKVQSITLKVNHNWEVIYKMDLEEVD